MSHSVHPLAFRLGITETWRSNWLARKHYQQYLKQDTLVRELITKKFYKIGLQRVDIERSANVFKIIIHSSRPGLVIGRSGQGLEELRRQILALLAKNTKFNPKQEIKLEIEEVREPESHAVLVAASIAEQLEKRLPYRRVIKQSLERSMENPRVKGVKILVKGRLNGADIARREWLAKGNIPRQTLRADIDYAHQSAYTIYGVVGVKVWIYKGERFADEEQNNKQAK